jgi:hypothetical protein
MSKAKTEGIDVELMSLSADSPLPSRSVSRRGLMTAATVVAAGAALPLTQAAATAGQDQALLALGHELSQLQADWIAETEFGREIDQIIEVRVREATGIAWEDAPDESDDDPTGYWKTHRAVSNSTPGYDPDLTRWAKLNDRLFALTELIFAETARTSGGLAIQAMAATMACRDLWYSEHGSPDRDFTQAVCRHVGVPPRPIESGEVEAQPT